MARQQYKLNVDADLYARVVASAKFNNRSINAEIAHQLQRAYDRMESRQFSPIRDAYFKAIDTERRDLDRMDSMAGNS